jgi:hypothetical protein
MVGDVLWGLADASLKTHVGSFAQTPATSKFAEVSDQFLEKKISGDRVDVRANLLAGAIVRQIQITVPDLVRMARLI